MSQPLLKNEPTEKPSPIKKSYPEHLDSDDLIGGPIETSVRRYNEVSQPKHYLQHPSGVECITITEHMNFNLGNAIKCIWRAGEKDADAHIKDLMKAKYYIEREISRLENYGVSEPSKGRSV